MIIILKEGKIKDFVFYQIRTSYLKNRFNLETLSCDLSKDLQTQMIRRQWDDFPCPPTSSHLIKAFPYSVKIPQVAARLQFIWMIEGFGLFLQKQINCLSRGNKPYLRVWIVFDCNMLLKSNLIILLWAVVASEAVWFEWMRGTLYEQNQNPRDDIPNQEKNPY